MANNEMYKNYFDMMSFCDTHTIQRTIANNQLVVDHDKKLCEIHMKRIKNKTSKQL